MEVNLMSLI